MFYFSKISRHSVQLKSEKKTFNTVICFQNCRFSSGLNVIAESLSRKFGCSFLSKQFKIFFSFHKSLLIIFFTSSRLLLQYSFLPLSTTLTLHHANLTWKRFCTYSNNTISYFLSQTLTVSTPTQINFNFHTVDTTQVIWPKYDTIQYNATLA